MTKKALIIDHDDSFIWNIKFWLQPEFNSTILNHSELNELRNPDQIDRKYDLIIFSPGPKSPHDYPKSLNLIQKLTTPSLGICLGFQMMTTANDGAVIAYSPPLHGKSSALLSLLPEFNGLMVARYHSLHCKPSNHFKVMAYSQDDETVMWGEHKTKRQIGFQFHPESFLTEEPERYKNYILNWIKT